MKSVILKFLDNSWGVKYPILRNAHAHNLVFILTFIHLNLNESVEESRNVNYIYLFLPNWKSVVQNMFSFC